MKVFYIRCSTEEQNEARQEEMARANGAERIYKDKASGKNTDRTDFKKMMEFVRDGDTVITESISRIARNTKDLLNIVEELQGKGVNFISLKEAIDTTTPQGKFMLTVFAAMAQLERENILQRQRANIKDASRKTLIQTSLKRLVRNGAQESAQQYLFKRRLISQAQLFTDG